MANQLISLAALLFAGSLFGGNPVPRSPRSDTLSLPQVAFTLVSDDHKGGSDHDSGDDRGERTESSGGSRSGSGGSRGSTESNRGDDGSDHDRVDDRGRDGVFEDKPDSSSSDGPDSLDDHDSDLPPVVL